MKNFFLLLFFLSFFVFHVFSQSIENFYTMPLFSQFIKSRKMDYISSCYYTKIAEAEYAYLKGEKKRAYDTLLKIEKVIPLISQAWRIMYPHIRQDKSTMYMFVELSLLNKNYVKAYQYITKLITQYGYKMNEFESMSNFDKMRKQNFYNAGSLMKEEKEFIADTMLWLQLKQMHHQDQYYRILLDKKKCFDREIWLPEDSCSYYEKQLSAMDDTNYNQLLELIKKDRFPSSQNIKYSQNMREEIEDVLLIMAIHTADSFLVNPIKPILFEMIKNGNASPGCLARMIDRGCMIYQHPYIYGMYNWLSIENIYDIENLDKRRAEIGLPPRKLECEIHNLQVRLFLKNMPKKKRKEYRKNNLFNCCF